MKPITNSLRDKQELLLRYVEEREGYRSGLTPEERASVEAWLLEDKAACQDAGKIANHLRMLSELRPPAIPGDLTTLCLEAIQGRRARRHYAFRKRWILAGAMAVLAIFLSGIWFSQGFLQSDVPSFLQLVQAQTYFIGRLETDLAGYYQQTSLQEDNPWFQPVQNLKITSRAISAAYEKYSGDPVIERGLSLAIAQNINLLKSLCDYIEDNNAIPDKDFEFFDTNQAISGNSI